MQYAGHRTRSAHGARAQTKKVSESARRVERALLSRVCEHRADHPLGRDLRVMSPAYWRPGDPAGDGVLAYVIRRLRPRYRASQPVVAPLLRDPARSQPEVGYLMTCDIAV